MRRGTSPSLGGGAVTGLGTAEWSQELESVGEVKASPPPQGSRCECCEQVAVEG